MLVSPPFDYLIGAGHFLRERGMIDNFSWSSSKEAVVFDQNCHAIVLVSQPFSSNNNSPDRNAWSRLFAAIRREAKNDEQLFL
jgi:hypothetical protein